MKIEMTYAEAAIVEIALHTIKETYEHTAYAQGLKTENSPTVIKINELIARIGTATVIKKEEEQNA